MSEPDLLAELARAGVVLWREGDALRYRAPAGAMTPDRLDRLRAQKAEVLARLADAARTVRVEIREPEPLRCYACRSVRDQREPVCPTCHPPPGRAGS